MATQAEIEAILKFKDEMSAQLRTLQGRVEELTTKKKALEGQVGNLKRGFGDLIQQTTGLSPKMLGLAGAVTALGLGVIKAVKDTVALGDELVEFNAKTGISIQALQELKFAAEQNDVSFNVLTDAVQKLGQRAAAELPDAKRAIEALGLSLDQIVQAKPEDAFLMVAERIKQIPNPAQQAAVAMAAFGRSGLEVLPGINQNLQESILRFRELDAAMSDEAARAAADLKDQLGELNVRWTELKTIVGSAVIPALLGILSPIESAKQAWTLFVNAVALGHAVLVEQAAKAIDGLAKAAYAAAVVVGENGTKIGDALSNMSIEAKALGQSLRADAAQGFLSVTAPAEATAKAGEKTGFVFRGLTEDAKKLKDQFTKTTEAWKILGQAMSQFDEVQHFQAIQQSAKAYAEEQREIRAATEALQPYLVAAKERLAVLNETAPKIVPIKIETQDWGNTQNVVNDALSEARGLFDLLGGSADSTLGKILGWATKIFDMFNGITGLISKVMGLFGGGGLGSLFGSGGAAAGAAGGGLGGIGGALAGFFTNPLTALIGGGIAGIFGLTKLFGKKGSAGTTADVLGIDFDALSKDFQKRLQDLGKQTGDFATALQMNLGEIFSQGGIGLDSFAEKIADTYSFLERGQINAAQAQTILNQTVAQLLPHLGSLGAGGVEQLQRLIGAAEHFGVTFEGIEQIAAFLGQTVATSTDQAASGLVNAAAAAASFRDQISAAIAASGGIAGARAALDAGKGYIPGMQHGGYVPPIPGGSLRRLGEGGEGEFVIPESQMGGAGITVNIDARGALGLDANRLADIVGQKLSDNWHRNPGGFKKTVQNTAGR